MHQTPIKNLSQRQKSLLSRLKKAQARIQRKISNGSFTLLTKRKQQQLLYRLRRYAFQLQRLGFNFQRIAMGSALMLALSLGNNATAQTFTEKTGTDNPLIFVENPLEDVQLSFYGSAFAFADIDADGDLDFFAGKSNGKVEYHKNIGSAANAEFALQSGSDNPLEQADVGYDAAPTFVDIDNDGDFDAFIGEDYGTIKFYKNTGSASNPSFQEQSGVSNPFDGVNAGGSAIPSFVDIDDDGDYDAFFGPGYGILRYYENIGNSNNPSFIEQTGNNNPFNAMDIGYDLYPDFVDIDNDGDFDAFVGKDDYGTFSFYKNTGTSSNPVFEEQPAHNNPLGAFQLYRMTSPQFVDIDADGDYDAFSGDYISNLHFFVNEGTKESSDMQPSKVIATLYPSQTFVDIDDDGDPDAFFGEGLGKINYYENTGTGSDPSFKFRNKNDNPLDGVQGYYWSNVNFVDIDNDGDFDAFIGQRYDGVLHFENIGDKANPVFEEQTGMANPLAQIDGYQTHPLFVDIDNDGDFDAFVGGDYEGPFGYYKNTGTAENPVFDLQSGSNNPFEEYDWYYLSASFADFDNDGDFDLIAGDYYGKIYYFENVGDSTNPEFNKLSDDDNPLGWGEGGYYAWISSEDIDDDGDIDVFVGDFFGNFRFYQNNLITGVTNPAQVERNITIFPNPIASNQPIQLQLTDFDGKVNISVLDFLGREVKQLIINKPQGIFSISTKGLTPGMYSIHISDGKRQGNVKVIVQN